VKTFLEGRIERHVALVNSKEVELYVIGAGPREISSE
jgi:hypothetical protein